MRVIDLLDSVAWDFDLEDLHLVETDHCGNDQLIGQYDISNGNYDTVPYDARCLKVLSWKVIPYKNGDIGLYFDLMIWV